MLGSTGPGAPPDSGLVACTYPLSTQDIPAADYPEIRAQFAGSRWPDLRTADTAYVDPAMRLSHARGTDGYQTVWFYQRLSATCPARTVKGSTIIRLTCSFYGGSKQAGAEKGDHEPHRSHPPSRRRPGRDAAALVASARATINVPADYFSCSTCHLVLNGHELIEQADLPGTFEVIDDDPILPEPEYGND